MAFLSFTRKCVRTPILIEVFGVAPIDKPTDKPVQEAPTFPAARVLDEVHRTPLTSLQLAQAQKRRVQANRWKRFRFLLNQADGRHLPEIKLVVKLKAELSR